ncbi:hypothetical protein CXG81DRAFT_19161 [Caulochytrium protostelioides]|uniref:Uncharacterized protein n=1 Tax=Caulochytrium protostelioides TaxID=1555241 RepID=A0A4P9X6X6_9FUNG|nr:hypothetical protein CAUPRSCDRAFT_11136 [Caulochytrium protostelioides]RKP00967.1 hypothetical protein CXG81DRAFT_19161 [Caulochytrium protostelioides]|eukprot:RKP00967.1 hypothetical protein CXG81DRAFT_19161 [Caulochytrium protostelioides]
MVAEAPRSGPPGSAGAGMAATSAARPRSRTPLAVVITVLMTTAFALVLTRTHSAVPRVVPYSPGRIHPHAAGPRTSSPSPAAAAAAAHANSISIETVHGGSNGDEAFLTLEQQQTLLQHYAPLVRLHAHDLWMPADPAKTFAQSMPSPDGTILTIPESLWRGDTPSRDGTIAAPVTAQIRLNGPGNVTYLQYWYFHPLNGCQGFRTLAWQGWKGRQIQNFEWCQMALHVGDWEHTTVQLDGLWDPTGQLSPPPVRRYFLAQHNGGVWLDPRDFEYATDEAGRDHPVLFSAMNSHASYHVLGTWKNPNPIFELVSRFVPMLTLGALNNLDIVDVGGEDAPVYLYNVHRERDLGASSPVASSPSGSSSRSPRLSGSPRRQRAAGLPDTRGDPRADAELDSFQSSVGDDAPDPDRFLGDDANDGDDDEETMDRADDGVVDDEPHDGDATRHRGRHHRAQAPDILPTHRQARMQSPGQGTRGGGFGGQVTLHGHPGRRASKPQRVLWRTWEQPFHVLIKGRPDLNPAWGEWAGSWGQEVDQGDVLFPPEGVTARLYLGVCIRVARLAGFLNSFVRVAERGPKGPMQHPEWESLDDPPLSRLVLPVESSHPHH